MAIPKGTLNVTSDGFEICVLCQEKADPPVFFSTPVDYRIGYVDGSGQTCANQKVCAERRNRSRE